MRRLLFCVTSSVTALSGCALLGVDKCEGPLDANESVVAIRLLNTSGNDLFSPSSRYSRDSLILRGERGELVPLLAGKQADQPLIIPLLDKDPPIGVPLKKAIILYLAKTDQDTIREEYVLFENDCDRPQFRTLKLYYNDVQIHENSTDIPVLLISKR